MREGYNAYYPTCSYRAWREGYYRWCAEESAQEARHSQAMENLAHHRNKAWKMLKESCNNYGSYASLAKYFTEKPESEPLHGAA